jgi:hypothetical protein
MSQFSGLWRQGPSIPAACNTWTPAHNNSINIIIQHIKENHNEINSWFLIRINFAVRWHVEKYKKDKLASNNWVTSRTVLQRWRKIKTVLPLSKTERLIYGKLIQ